MTHRPSVGQCLLVVVVAVLLGLLLPPAAVVSSVAPSNPTTTGLETMALTAPTVSAHQSFTVDASSATSAGFSSSQGDTIIVFVSLYGKNTVSLADNSHDPFSPLLDERQDNPTGYNSLWIFAAYSVTAGSSKTVTATLSGSSIYSAGVDIIDVSGVGPKPLDHLGTPSNDSTSKNAPNASTQVAATASDLVLAGVGAHQTRIWSATSTDTLLNDAHSPVSGANVTAADFDRDATVTGATWMNATVTKPNTHWIADGLSLKPVGSVGPQYTVKFRETGLPAAQPWYVTLASTINPPTKSTLTFSVPNGTYPFTVGAISGFTSTPGSGSVTVKGFYKTVNIAFAKDTSDWPTYLGGVTRDAANYQETALSSANAANLTELWNVSTNGIQAEPVVSNGTVYIGADNGDEYAINATTGAVLWDTYIGQVLQPKVGPVGCNPYVAGITSSATVTGGMVYVGGGNITGTGNISNGITGWYALNASTGKVAWDLPIGEIAKGSYNWASPLIADGYAYIGNASRCDRPLVWGGLFQVSLTTHKVVGFFNTSVGSKYVGSSIWGSPTFDAGNNTIFFATGNPLRNYTSLYSEAVVAINATTLAPLGSWQVPGNQAIGDSDFGSTPTYYHLSNGTPMIAVENKNGIVYAFEAKKITAGPVWETVVSNGTTPENVAPLSWGGGLLYDGSAAGKVGGKLYQGVIRALYPGNGTPKWQVGMEGDVYGAPVYSNGIVVVAGGDDLDVLNASTGQVLTEWDCGRTFYSAPAIAEGRIYAGCKGTYAFGFSGMAPEPLERPSERTSPSAPLPAPRSPEILGLPAYSTFVMAVRPPTEAREDRKLARSFVRDRHERGRTVRPRSTEDSNSLLGNRHPK